MKKTIRFLKLTSLAAGLIVLSACGGGGSGSSAPTTTTQAGVAVVKINDASVSTIAVAADQYGRERIALVGNKDASGTPISLTEVYYSTLGAVLKIELGPDGLPLVLSDQVGNKFTLTNYTASTVDVTFFDHEGGRIVGPSTIAIDPTRLASVKNANKQVQKVAALVQDDVSPLLDKAGNVLGLVDCGINILESTGLTAVALPLGVAMGTYTALNCGVTLAQSAGIIMGIKNPLVEKLSLDLDIAGTIMLQPASAINLAIDRYDFFVGASAPEKPTGLAVYPYYGFNKIFWKSPFSDTSISGYSIYRDDTYLSIGNAQSGYFEDVNVNPGSRYCYQVQAYSKNGKYSEKSDQQCVTVPAAVAPSATTGSATNITSSSVTLNGSVNPNGAAADAFFEFGTSVSYGNQAGGLSLAGNGSSSIIMTTDLSGLVSNKTYHYRVVAKNSGSTSYGSDQTFQTIMPVTAAPTISSVSSVTGSDNLQPFTINGSNFVSGANITLRDKRTGEVFPNRQPTSFTNTKITLSTRFSTVAGTWSVNVVNPDNSSTGEYVFTVAAPPAGSLTTPTNTTPGSISSPGPMMSSSTVGLSWLVVSGATYYDLGVTDIATGLLVVDTTSSGTAYTASLSAGKQYRWNVAACNSAGCSNYTTLLYFQTPSLSTTPAPVISSVTPNPVKGSNSQQYFAINGSNFVSGANIILRDLTAGQTFSNRVASSFSSTLIMLTPTFTTAAHNWSVEVVNPDGQSSGQYSFNVVAPATATAPVISSVSPNPVTGSSSAQAFSIYGSGFVSGANVILRDLTAGQTFSNRAASSFSSTQIVLNPTFTTAAHSWSVEVVNPDGQSSGQYSFNVVAPATAPAPVISSVTPNPVTGSNSQQYFAINGSNFVSGANIILRDLTAGQTFPNRVASSFSSTLIMLTPNFTTAAHSWSVEVINPDGQSSGQYHFNVI